MAIHCHSARYHYDSFHNRGGDIINIGSNNTYNFGSCGFGSSIWCNGGNFWGGFGTSLGWGLGQGLMNWLGNGLNGGGWNPAGIFGGYGMGYGMSYGMNPWQQMSTCSWGGSTGGGRSTSGTGSSSSHADCVDSDRQLINQLGSKVINLQKNPSASKDDAVKLYKEIAKAKENTNDIHKDTDQNDYDNWMNVLQNYATSKGWGNLSDTNTATQAQSTTPTTTSTTTPSSTTPTTPATPTSPANPTATTPSTTGAGTGTGSTGGTGSTPAQTTSSTPWSGVTSWGDNRLTNIKVNDDLKNHDYDSVSDNDNITEVKVTREIDGTMHDINGRSCELSTEKVKKGGKDSNIPMYIAITSSQSGKIFKYKYVGTTADGNPVYATPASDKNNNVYVLAKKSTKEGDSFELIQLKGFSGHTHRDEQNG